MTENTNQTSIDAEKVKSCWLKIKSAKGTDFFVNDFYRLLFKRHPEVQRLFPDDLIKQKSKLLNMLDNVINGIEYIDELEDVLIELGKHHKDIGITEETYATFITTVIEAANTSSAYQLSKDELDAWEDAFRKVSNIMLKAY